MAKKTKKAVGKKKPAKSGGKKAIRGFASDLKKASKTKGSINP